MIDYLDETLTEQKDNENRKKRNIEHKETHADLNEGELDHLGSLLDQMTRVIVIIVATTSTTSITFVGNSNG